jgi:hypothetical protein
LLEAPSKPLLLEGAVREFCGFLNAYSDYIIPIQQWIEKSYNDTWHSWCDFGIFSHFHELTSYFSFVMTELPAHVQLIFTVSLF